MGFRGWAAQPGLRTVEGVVREALASVFSAWSELAVAGRTDTGVHALANVASVEGEGGPPPARAREGRRAEGGQVLARHEVVPALSPAETQDQVLVRVVGSAVWHRRGDALEFE